VSEINKNIKTVRIKKVRRRAAGAGVGHINACKWRQK